MSFYDSIINKIKNIQEEDEVISNISVSSFLASEVALISSLLVSAILLRHINFILMVFIVLILFGSVISSMPLMPRFRKEQNDSYDNMLFYVYLVFGVLTALVYWGVNYV